MEETTVIKNIKVDMPEKGCIINKNNSKKIPYVYYATEYYRDSNGTPRTTRVLIGKKDEESGKLIPNDNYFEIFDMEVIIRKKGGI